MREVLEAGGAETVEAEGQGLVGQEHESPGTGVEMEGVEVPADGTEHELVVEGDVNDTPTVDQEDPDGENAQVPVDDDSAATNTTTMLSNDGTETVSFVNTNSTFSPSITASRVTVWDGDKVVEVDTGRSKPKGDGNQSVQAEEPETTGGSTAEGDVTKGNDEVALTVADTALQGSRTVIASLTAQLTAARAETDEVREDLAAAVELARKAVEGTATILEQLSKTPMGRKTGYIDANKSFSKLRDDIYGPDVQQLLTKGTN